MQEMYTDIERIVLEWLTRHKIDFQFATSLRGGFFELGGAVVDFILPARMLAWRVMGEYWHTGVTAEGHDLVQRELLTELGYIVVDLWGQDLQNRLDETMRLALQGREMLRG